MRHYFCNFHAYTVDNELVEVMIALCKETKRLARFIKIYDTNGEVREVGAYRYVEPEAKDANKFSFLPKQDFNRVLHDSRKAFEEAKGSRSYRPKTRRMQQTQFISSGNASLNIDDAVSLRSLIKDEYMHGVSGGARIKHAIDWVFANDGIIEFSIPQRKLSYPDWGVFS